MLRKFAISIVLCIALTACASLGEVPTKKLATATLRQANGLPAGTAILTAAGEKVTLSLALAGLPAGQKGMHLHMVGRCDAPDFASAGGHLNPGGRQHGTANPSGSHLGDLPNVVIDSNGAAAVSAQLPGTRAVLEAALFDADGTAIVVHAGPDDYRTDPSGNSGARIACGVLTRS
ncbi:MULTISPECIES: superoxide dismutase family protein [unclassified Novosphingobium]|uniref:superoxide dismutase family protein n=1 Tax=unclassified Novosphingobium TaxID=2644732 RepID=UPI0025EEB286|nr:MULTISPECIES: superoxide dismutase family protein [unclassified Novosphingobium]HQV05089.1 superoxide dismutase family protein [Novosphingobium sp.]